MQPLTPLALLASILPLASALWIPKRAVNLTTFEIPVMSSHFMGDDSGIGSGAWPASEVFNSTLDFTLTYAESATGAPINATCAANWTENTPPTEWVPCSGSPISWRFDNFTTPGDFVLEVAHTNSGPYYYIGKANITSDNASDPTSYLTCLGGAPYSGIHCNLDGILSYTKDPIAIMASTVAAPRSEPYAGASA